MSPGVRRTAKHFKGAGGAPTCQLLDGCPNLSDSLGFFEVTLGTAGQLIIFRGAGGVPAFRIFSRIRAQLALIDYTLG